MSTWIGGKGEDSPEGMQHGYIYLPGRGYYALAAQSSGNFSVEFDHGLCAEVDCITLGSDLPCIDTTSVAKYLCSE